MEEEVTSRETAAKADQDQDLVEVADQDPPAPEATPEVHPEEAKDITEEVTAPKEKSQVVAKPVEHLLAIVAEVVTRAEATARAAKTLVLLLVEPPDLSQGIEELQVFQSLQSEARVKRRDLTESLTHHAKALQSRMKS